ncbi:HAD family hydrolase [Streptomyces sp. NPDC053048]|uniref:HAD family hydrolase n=1 Tax=Streptomyces sp. NPDC053048 TaxID=3365694 RepID=UPI0037D09CC8
MTGSVAFFDVDETLISGKSMWSFWNHWVVTTTEGPVERDPVELLPDLSRLTRADANRAYYRLFAGVSADRLGEAGRSWYAEYRSRPDAAVITTLLELRRHQRRGDRVVLVSGSFSACLTPVAEDLGADLVLCTRQLTDPEGVLTGEVLRPVIGEGKAAAVAATLADWAVAPGDCFAYGDHSSDLPMLSAVGHPVVVGGDPVLVEHARRPGWRVLPAVAGPLDTPTGGGGERPAVSTL